jgi:hypothetical protein
MRPAWLIYPLLCSCALGWEEISPIDVKINEGVTFSLDFNSGSFFPARAAGDPVIQSSPKATFQDGIKGKALCSGDRDTCLRFKTKDNISFFTPGTVSLWIKPVKWKYPRDMPLDQNRHKVRLFQAFFLTDYDPDKGYLGVQRCTSHADTGSDSLSFFLLKFKNLGAGMEKSVCFNAGEWHNIVMTWDPLKFQVYLNGNLFMRTMIKRRINDNELSPYFSICCPAGSMLDEIFIYNHDLTPETVREFYDYYTGGVK